MHIYTLTPIYLMKIVALIAKIYLLLSVLFVVVALLAFTGIKESEVAGNLVLSMLVVGFPGSLLAYPLALTVADLFEAYGMFAYNSRIVLLSWWVVYFILGVAQWFGLSWLIRQRKPNK